MFKPFTHLLIASVLSSCLTASVLAGEDDFEQPIKVDARSQFVDGKNKLSVFKGDVHITQGTLVIDADEVEVDASAGEGKEVFIARGQPATYSQQLDDGQQVVAKANEIRYQVSERTISLDGNAELVRDTSSVSGNSIIYDMAREQLLAESSDDNNGRVTTVFRPESLQEVNNEKPDAKSDDKKADQKEEDKPKP